MTPQEKIAIFHAYNGAMVKTEKGAAPFHIMTQDMVCVRYNSTDLGDWHLISDCQLLLTDLSLISDEHKIAIGVILGYEGSGDGNCKHWAEWFIDSYGFGAKKQGNFHAIRVQQITDQLRLWNYNIGYSKYTAADLVNERVVILNHENKGI